MNKQNLGYLYALITILIWGSTFVVTKVLLESLEPTQILITRFIITVLILVMLCPRYKLVYPWKTERLFLFGGLAIAGYFVFENNGINNTYASNVSLIIATIPLITNLLTSIVNRKNFFTRKTTTGFVISYVGVFLIVFTGTGIEGVNPIGDLFALLAAVSFAVYSIFLARIDDEINIIIRTRRIFLYAVIFITIYAISFGLPIVPTFQHPKEVFELLFLAIIASSLAFILWNKAVEYNGSVRTNVFTYLNPVVTMVVSIIVLGEVVSLWKVLGGVIIILGIYLSESEQKQIN